jgi:hypothetical protein
LINVSVKDNGIGIEQQYADRIFLIFQRLSRRNEYSGTGMGLAVCKRIVERHSGKIWFESQIGEGTTFYFTIRKEVNNSSAEIMRQKAEKTMNKRTSQSVSEYSEDETMKLKHELEVYKLEMEMQNEELKRAKSVTQEDSEKYIELYDFAPMAYFTFSREGKIIASNLWGANMPGKDRSHLINSMFGFFVSGDARPVSNQFLDRVFTGRVKETCAITISTLDNLPINVYLAGIVTKNEEQCLVTAIDITGRNSLKKIE